MLRLRQERSDQISFTDLLLPPGAGELPPELAKLDQWLDDERFFTPFRDRYHRYLGRPSVPAETYLRLIALKHQYGLSDREVCAQVSDRISWRRFCRIPWADPTPHPSSLTKIRQRLDAGGGDHMAVINAHLVRKARERRLLTSRRVRMDTTVVESNIHYPTESSLIADTVRVVTRLANRIQAAIGGTVIRDRARSIKKRVLLIGKVMKRRTGESIDDVRRITGEMADIAEQTLRSAREVIRKAAQIGQSRQERLSEELENALSLGERVVRQARQVNEGQGSLPERLVSIFDPQARPIRRGKPGRKTEFGYKLRVTETAERLVTEYRVMIGNPPDTELLMPGVTEHAHHTGQMPQGVATDRGFWSLTNERGLGDIGVKRVSLPFMGKRSASRTVHERQPWFRRLQRWRAGLEGTISVLKRRYGLGRTLYRGLSGCQRWVGEVIWAYNLNRIAKLA